MSTAAHWYRWRNLIRGLIRNQAIEEEKTMGCNILDRRLFFVCLFICFDVIVIVLFPWREKRERINYMLKMLTPMMTRCFCMSLKESNMYYQLRNEAQAATLSSPRRHGRKRRLDSSYREILGLFSCQISLVCFVKILLLATTQLKKKKFKWRQIWSLKETLSSTEIAFLAVCVASVSLALIRSSHSTK